MTNCQYLRSAGIYDETMVGWAYPLGGIIDNGVLRFMGT